MIYAHSRTLVLVKRANEKGELHLSGLLPKASYCLCEIGASGTVYVSIILP
jgi:hypothetical protein